MLIVCSRGCGVDFRGTSAGYSMSQSQPTTPLHPGRAGLGGSRPVVDGLPGPPTDGNASVDYLSAPVHAGLSPSLWATPGHLPQSRLG